MAEPEERLDRGELVFEETCRWRKSSREELLVPPVLIAKVSHQPWSQQEAGGSSEWETEAFYEGTA